MHTYTHIHVRTFTANEPCRQVAAQLGTQGLCNVSWALAVLRVGPPRDMAEVLMLEAQVRARCARLFSRVGARAHMMKWLQGNFSFVCVGG